MNNLLDLSDEGNQRFIGSVLCVLCKDSPLTLDLLDIEKFWNGDVIKLQYDLRADVEGKTGTVTFSLKDTNE